MTYNATILAESSLVAFWPLNDVGGSSTAADSTGNGHTLTKAGTVTFGATGIGDGDTAIQVAGAGELSRTGDSGFNLAQTSAEIWFKQAATASVGALVSATNHACYIDGTGKGELNDGTHDFKSSGTYADSVWHHVAVLWDRTNLAMSLYIDAVFIGSQTLATGTAGTGLAVAQQIAGGDNFTGSLAKAALYGALLSPTQISAHYTAGGGSATPPATVAVDDANVFWSPYTWKVSGSSYAESNTPGAYVKLGFGGRTLRADVDVSALGTAGVPAASYPVLRCAIDDGPWQDVQLWAGTTIGVPLGLNLALGTHQAAIYFLRADNTYDRWTTPVQAVKIADFLIDAGQASAAPAPLGTRAVVYGDSITEGQKILAATIPAGGDATLAYGALVAGALGAEYGAIAFGGQGWTLGGPGNVPAFHNGSGTKTWDLHWSGQSRLVAGLLSPAPDYVIVNQGTNDGAGAVSGATVAAALASWLAAIRVAAPTAWIFVLVPFGYWERTGLYTGMASYQAGTPDAKALIVDVGQIPGMATVGGSATLYSTDGIHANQYGQAYAGALVAEAIGVALGEQLLVAETVQKAVITSATTTVVKAFPGLLRGVACVSGTPATVTIYDHASLASGQKLYDQVAPANGVPQALGIPASNGITVVTTSAATVVVTYS